MPNRPGRPWRRVRDAVLKRDGGICWICGQPGANSADHLIPRSVRPDLEMDLSNLAAAHLRCNVKRKTKPVEEVIQDRKNNLNAESGWQW